MKYLKRVLNLSSISRMFKKQNPRLSGKTPFYLYTTNMIEWAKKKGITEQ